MVLTARATSARDGVLSLSLLTVAVKSRLLATRALGFFGADAASLTTAAGH